MLPQQSLKLAAILSLAIATSFWQHSISNSQIVDIQKQRQQARSPVQEERYTTRLLDLSGNEIAQYQGRFDRFSPDGQRLITES
ncbi:MAG: hypothetical protein F6K28_53310, partial [Microcoleus sp. SIO2G3]|nr:hypothetical protein [Microcoleus sp. SIO2G3]